MNFDVIRNSRTYKYLVSVGLLQTCGYSLCLALYLFAISDGLAHNTVNMSGGAIMMPIIIIIILIAIVTIILTLIAPIIFLIDTIKPLIKQDYFFPLWLEILCLTVYTTTIFGVIITPYLCKD